MEKLNWKKLCKKAWKNGLYVALKEEVCPIIPLQFDEMALEVVDKVIDTFFKEEIEE